MNLISTKLGRLTAFGGMYLSEGLPQGFASVALALEFNRRGMDAAAIGAFAGTILLPWSWKFLAGPLVDNLHLRRFGARKQWIIFAQTGMLVVLAIALSRMPEVVAGQTVGLGLFTALMILHNVLCVEPVVGFTRKAGGATGNVRSFLRNARALAGSLSRLPRLVRIVA